MLHENNAIKSDCAIVSFPSVVHIYRILAGVFGSDSLSIRRSFTITAPKYDVFRELAVVDHIRGSHLSLTFRQAPILCSVSLRQVETNSD